MGNHLRAVDIDVYVEQEMDAGTRAGLEAHLAVCPLCRSRVTRERFIETTLRAIPHAIVPRDLSARITAAVELRVAEGRARRERLPFIIAATCFSSLLLIWFGIQMLFAFEERGALDFVSLVTSRPEVFATYSTDAYFALLESLPLSEIVLTLFALLIVLVLAQQWVDTVQPNLSFLPRGRPEPKP